MKAGTQSRTQASHCPVACTQGSRVCALEGTWAGQRAGALNAPIGMAKVQEGRGALMLGHEGQRADQRPAPACKSALCVSVELLHASAGLHECRRRLSCYAQAGRVSSGLSWLGAMCMLTGRCLCRLHCQPQTRVVSLIPQSQPVDHWTHHGGPPGGWPHGPVSVLAQSGKQGAQVTPGDAVCTCHLQKRA